LRKKFSVEVSGYVEVFLIGEARPDEKWGLLSKGKYLRGRSILY
jgi:hypothetical protein